MILYFFHKGDLVKPYSVPELDGHGELRGDKGRGTLATGKLSFKESGKF